MTGSIISALALLAYTAPESTFLPWSLPLGMGLGIVFAASTGSFLIPQSTRLGSSLFAVYLYGGMILFGAMLLHDVQRVLQTAEKLPFDPDRPDTFDPINAAMAMYMDCLNIFVRFVQLFALQEVAKRIKK
ncbi:Growth hormone-inducible transmembrane protein [Folsomia candida]|uniref:Growth hormone-inducible transmembrane protein n=2 Tax=Folsomia candida TaxID=158441 RepID=A0A226E133_FOLCA|nr:Growth hormone-inducible transmembrane protein [Folsomia candida]